MSVLKVNDLEVVILAGGKGTRLRGVVNDRPKPMADVWGRPFLEWMLLALRNQGIRRVVLATGYRGEMIEDYFGNGAQWGIEIRHSRESTALGTGGAIRLAACHVDSDRFVVLNGDSYCRINAEELVTSHRDNPGIATLWLVEQQDCRRYGTVLTDGDGMITAFVEKSSSVGPGLINAGVYLLDRKILNDIQSDTLVSLERDVFPQLVGKHLFGIAGSGPFLDIGIPEAYAQASSLIAAESLQWTLPTAA